MWKLSKITSLMILIIKIVLLNHILIQCSLAKILTRVIFDLLLCILNKYYFYCYL